MRKELLHTDESGYLQRVTVPALPGAHISSHAPPSDQGRGGGRDLTLRSVSRAWLTRSNYFQLPQRIDAILAQLRLFNWGNEGTVPGIARLYHFFIVTLF